MEEERSAGFVVFKRTKEGTLFLLIRSSEHSYWGFPKGLIDPGEDELTAAKRELEEETGLADIRLVSDFRVLNHYVYTREGKRISKTVTFFLAEVLGGEVRLSHEHTDFLWASYEEALELIPYENLRDVLARAVERLRAESE